MLNHEEIKFLKLKANDIRQSVIVSLMSTATSKYPASGHTAGPLGMADVFTFFYFKALKHNPKNPSMEDRDLVILSNGHICPVLYASMAHSGYFDIEELKTLRHFGSRLQGHPHREFLPALESSSGPLGSGLSQAVGMALADFIDKKNKDRYVYCFLGDGEMNEGNNWEAIMLAGKHKLNNLIAIIDRNLIQIDGNTEDIMPLEPFGDKWRSFNWHVIEVNGHDFQSLNKALEDAHMISDKPIVLIANTIPSKGVKEWEGDYKWHGKPPTKEEGQKALEELQKERELIK